VQMRQQRFDGIENETQIRFAVLIEWSRHTENKRIDFGGAGKIRGWVEAASDGILDARWCDMLDVGFSRPERVDLDLIDIETDNLVPDLAIAKHQRQPDIAEPHNSYRRRLAVELRD
jgi:hypothetical protein